MNTFQKDLEALTSNYDELLWPIDTFSFMDFTKEVIESSVELIRDNFNTDNRIDSSVRVLNSHYIKKVLNYVYCETAISSIKKNREFKVLEPFTEFLTKEIQDIGYLRHFRNGLRKSMRSHNFIFSSFQNKIVTFVKNDGFKRISTPVRGEIVSTGGGELASNYLKSLHINNNANLIKIGDIFENNPLPLNNFTSDELNKFRFYLEGVQEIFCRAQYTEYKISLEKTNQWSLEFLEYICALFLDLEKKNIYFDQLWTGSAGIVWNKVLAIHVRRVGGKVTVFDHANGSNLSTNSFMQFVELQETDNFVTYTKKQVEYMSDNLDERLYFNNSKPKLISLYE